MTPLRLVALLLGLVVFPPPAAGAQALPVFDQGRTYPREADFQRAIQPYQAALAADARNARAHYWLGVAYLYAYPQDRGGGGRPPPRRPPPHGGGGARPPDALRGRGIHGGDVPLGDAAGAVAHRHHRGESPRIPAEPDRRHADGLQRGPRAGLRSDDEADCRAAAARRFGLPAWRLRPEGLHPGRTPLRGRPDQLRPGGDGPAARGRAGAGGLRPRAAPPPTRREGAGGPRGHLGGPQDGRSGGGAAV